MIFLQQRCIKNGHQSIAYESCQRTLLVPDLLDHNPQVTVEQIHHLLRSHTLAQPGIPTNVSEDDRDLLGLSPQVQRHRVFDQLLHDVRVNVAFKNTSHLLCLRLRTLQLGPVINHQRYTNVVVLSIEQCGNVEIQVHLASAGNVTIDRISHHRAMLMLYPGILQQFANTNLWSGSKNVPVVPPYRALRIHAQGLRSCTIKGRDDA